MGVVTRAMKSSFGLEHPPETTFQNLGGQIVGGSSSEVGLDRLIFLIFSLHPEK